MTHLEKVGINPRSYYKDTPIGIYAYPYEWMMSELDKIKDWSGKQISSVLPFESGAPFITFFSLKSSANVLFLSEATKKDRDEARLKLMDIFSEMGNYPLEKVKTFFRSRINAELARGETDLVNPNYPGNVIWFMSYIVAKELSKKRSSGKFGDGGPESYFNKLSTMQPDPDLGQAFLTSYDYTSTTEDRQIQMLWKRVLGLEKDLKEIGKLSDNQKAQLKEKLISKISKSREQRTKWGGVGTAPGMAVIWNKVLRELGYDAIVDNGGTGVIHKAEPFQMVVLNPKAIDKTIRVKNEPEPSGPYSNAKEKLLLKRLELGTLTLPIAASILGLPKDKATVDYMLSSDQYTNYSKNGPFRNALEKYLRNTLYYGGSKEEIDHKIDRLEKGFGKYSLSNLMINILNDSSFSLLFGANHGPVLVMTMIKYINPEDMSKAGLERLILAWSVSPSNKDMMVYARTVSQVYRAYNEIPGFKSWVDSLSETDETEKRVKTTIEGMIDFYKQSANK